MKLSMKNAQLFKKPKEKTKKIIFYKRIKNRNIFVFWFLKRFI